MTLPKVAVTRALTPKANQWLEKLSKEWDLKWWNEAKQMSREDYFSYSKGADGILVIPGCYKVDGEFLDHIGPQLKVVSTMSVGYDHIDVKELKKRNIRLGYTPDVLTDATADINLGLALMVTRNLYKGVKCVHEGGWGPWEPNFMVGTSISGKTIGIFGAGRIGQATARRFKGFNPSKIIYNSRSRKPEFENEVGASFVSFDELIKTSDILSINCVFNEDTKHLFNADTFSKMKNSAILLNSSRGGVIKQDDLIQALKSGQLGGAGLDVTDPEPLPLDSELLKLENVVITPHVGSANIETREAMADLAIKNLIAGLKGEDMAAEVKL